MARLVFLGTAGDAVSVGKQLRASGGFVLQLDDCQLHIDPGPGALVQLAARGIPVRDHTAIIVSQHHLIHAHDVSAVIHAMTLAGQDHHGVLVCPQSFVPQLQDFHRQCIERVVLVEPGKKLGIESVDIECVPADHPGGVGFRLQTPQFTLLYTGDTRLTRDITESYGKADIVIINTTFAKDAIGHHLSVEDAGKIIQALQPRLAILTHFGHHLLTQNPLYAARELQQATGVEVMAAEDGLSIDPVAYASEQQRTLGSFANKTR